MVNYTTHIGWRAEKTGNQNVNHPIAQTVRNRLVEVVCYF